VEFVMHELPVGIMVSDAEGRIVSFNASAQRILGCEAFDVGQDDRTRAYGYHVADTVTPFPADRLPLTRALRGEIVTDVEIFVRNENVSSGVWISASAAPWRNEDGGVSGAVVVLRDITSQKETLEKIERLSSAVEQTADAVIITDMKGTITYVNEASSG
jgi:PAS domain S-box-containing protein